MKRIFLITAVLACLISVLSFFSAPVSASSMTTRRTYGTRALSDGLSRMPTVAADLSTKDTVIFQIVLCNTTAGAITTTIKDKQSTARFILNAASIAGNTTYVIAFPEGVRMKSGVNWVASGDGLDAEVVAWRVE